jgi:hypothetical protein
MMSKLSTRIGIIALAALAACGGDSTAPKTITKPTSDLHFLRLSATAPQLQSTVVSFYAVRGQDREVRVRFTNGEDYLRFRVFANSLLLRPDGTTIANGDSVLITITITDPTKLQADFQPAGLKFVASAPARLQFEFAEADKDLNEDGVVNGTDTALIPQISTWRQEVAGGDWVKVSSLVEIEINEVQADISGFSGYALAY